MNDPHEDATWVYSYDCGGNILSKARYAYTTGEVGAALETIPYAYGDSNWRDKLTAYNGQTIAYDAIGNMLNDGTRRYTWAVGRQLQRIEMPMTEEECAACAEGVSGEIRLAIDFSGSNVLEATGASVVATARVMNGSVDMTNDIPATMFAWTRDSGDATADAAWNALHAGMKQITMARAELSGNVKYFCTLQPFEDYGTMEVDSTFMASHTPGEADADDVFSIENGDLMVDTEKEEGAYSLAGQRVMAATLLGSAVTASAWVYTAWPDKGVDFKYNADGLRMQKKVTAGDAVTVTDYVLHGELVVETTVTRSMNGVAVDVQRMHFFYDAQSRPAMLEWNGERYTYVHNLQGDVIAILDSNGVKVVEYSYDAWGKLLSTTGTLIIADLNPFRYRGYVYDAETDLYYLRSRYYNAQAGRFVNADSVISVLYSPCNNVNSYAKCRPTMRVDPEGNVDIIYRSKDDYWVENDSVFHTFFYGTNYYVESGGKRYRANSHETVTLYSWSILDTEFLDQRFDSMINNAKSSSSLKSVLKESIGGKLDFKKKLNKKKLYYLNGIVYNPNEAGNFIWAYFLKSCNYIDALGGILAQAGSLKNYKGKAWRPRFDETHDRAARYAGLLYWYQRHGKKWMFRLKYGFLDKV